MKNNIVSENIEIGNFDEYQYYEVDKNYIDNKWVSLDGKIDLFFNLSRNDIDNCYKKPQFAGYFSEIFENINISRNRHRDIPVWIAYEGDSHGGRSTMYYLDNHQRRDIENLFCGIKSLDGFLELLYFYYEIPKKGNFWHCQAGRDYTIIRSVSILEGHLEKVCNHRDNDKDYILDKCVSSGVTILICDSSAEICFYIISKEGNLIEKRISVQNKLNISKHEKLIYESNIIINY